MPYKLFIAIFFILQTLNFQSNLLGVARHLHFEEFADLTESMVYGRLALNEQRGMMKSGGLLVRFQCAEPHFMNQYQLLAYLGDEEICDPVVPYKSRPSIQGFVYGAIIALSPFDREANLVVLRWFVSLLSAVCLSWLVWWVVHTFSLFSGILASLAFLFSPWITVSGGHLYWMSGVLFLPFMFVVIRMNDEKLRPLLLFGGTAGFFLLKSMCIGFELFTTTLVMYTIPVFYAAFSRKWSMRQFLSRFSLVSGGLLTGLALSIAVLLLQISYDEGAGITGFDHIKERLVLRTTGNDEHQIKHPLIKASAEATLSETLSRYWMVALFRIPIPFVRTWGPDALPLPAIAVLGGGLLLALWGVFWKRQRALSMTVLVSVLAPMSWLVLFKAHSFLHPHLNTIGWFLPTVVLMVILGGEMVREWAGNSRMKTWEQDYF